MVVPRLLFTYIKTDIRNCDARLLGVYFSNNNENVAPGKNQEHGFRGSQCTDNNIRSNATNKKV